MAKITLKGNEINTIGELPKVGTQAPNFHLVATDLSEKTVEDFKGTRLVLNIFPSVDTGICATSVRKFNQEVSNLKNTKVLCISKDLPFAHSRFCGAEGLENVVSLSDFRSGDFGKNYQCTIADGALAGLLSRAIVIVDEQGKVIYTEQVPEIGQEPDYENALKTL
ncbi:MAG: thiol peroxidase [Flavobacteriaceae bacterium]|nr:thiol peroxidase [Flavobacteriaceae bacterium]